MKPPGTERGTAVPGAEKTRAGAGAALLLVASVHLLTTAGAWYVTDHAEYLFVARRLLDHGSFDLAEPGVRRLDALPWVLPSSGETLRTRLLPVTPLTLVPFLALDRALGLEHPSQYGRLVHLQGHVFVLAGLGLLASALRRAGASAQATAVAVALTGLCWPVWLIARRIGPEPILLFLVCLYLAAESWVDARGRRRRGLVRFAVCALLPWVSPTGPLIGLALVLAEAFDALPCRRRGHDVGRVRPGPVLPATALLVGIAGHTWLWNLHYHGHWWLGGYASYYASQGPFGASDPWSGLAVHVWDLVRQSPWLLLLALLGLSASRSPQAAGLTLPATLTVLLLAVFATFHQPEPARRLAVVWPCWAALVGRTWDRLELRNPLPQMLVALAGATGLHGLFRDEGRRHLGPDGLYYPNVLWVERLISGAPLWQWAPVLAALLLALLASGLSAWRLLRHAAPSQPA